MAVEHDQQTTGFGQVSRLKGLVFEYLSFGASVVGILALAVLLIYVTVDAFELNNASPEWLLTYVATLVVPYVGFCLYSANDREVTRRVALALGGGLIATPLIINGFELLVRPIPRLGWHLVYLFVVVIPVTCYSTYVGSQRPLGRVGFGFVGRLLGGTALGIAMILLFVVFDQYLWLLTYTFGLIPAAAALAYSRYRESDLAALLAYPIGAAGLGAAFYVRGLFDVYPTTWLIFVWTLAIPASGAVAAVVARDEDTRTGLVLGGVAFLLAVGGSFAAGQVGMESKNVLLVLLTTGIPTVAFGRRMVTAERERIGLLLPVLIVAGAVLGTVLVRTMGFPGPNSWLDPSFVTGSASSTPRKAGFYPPIVGSVMIIAFVALVSFVLGVGSAVFLEEYASDSGITGTITRVIQINIANLAAVPSVVYGLLGLGLFINLLGLGMGAIVTAVLTLSLLILPITIISAQEAIRSVPDDLRNGSYAMGATRWQTTKNVVLPEAFPGILTGTILALGRAIGETAPLIIIGVPHLTYSPPNGIWDQASAMPLQIYVWSHSAIGEFRYGVLAAGVVTLLFVLIGMNATAIILRNRFER
ncbi:phosphate ABC transporter permease PstA [Haloterrigena sp. SYSU A558-1]|uniref:Phosphate transport system permease protein PstA n=1 Tax=Haloterrigena gelatinilytica TaxID=2741724 RepID=A0A8J8GK18_9EURY|nr:phosphate ABC transporter permease PstA [Haloterrigena gelatinilytica]NUB89752.1 phosphate ABC transporter permease PstA [Haloterrigena gelatinilytica]NUC74416.1 phosphate ABC transporter permease PstA [Haloterrigena gelatinilytica]